jgi:hypothetical protein
MAFPICITTLSSLQSTTYHHEVGAGKAKRFELRSIIVTNPDHGL